ncbi:aminoglycoside phosphotransferase family protein [Flavilitoribacter nigricans]|uniref:Phosphotransferase n=1 Tax=Flavilitoribacter nigricans (strain ATCC 23147 / DSM 23189 / NBRC 102662 / NCIMB 1420 / SS-2) TaxID=1122177 RepID=A0A2D0MXI6_FLAN2|nr:aminoglycoside phosphotransferase family protein [Flavilitoribacter nigricans]PHN00992.1 phosphotransferase [Flavilitoribacter nigricans DSM 23189 = NBRC 102662]
MIPPAEIAISEQLVKQLVAEQFPEFAHLKVRFLDTGWDNESYKIGDRFIARIPRRQLAVELLHNEIRWLPQLETQLPIRIPAPLGIGQPTDYYPWPWTIVPWFAGRAADEATVQNAAALPLATFLRALHRPAPADIPTNDYRGVPLEIRAADVFRRLDLLANRKDLITDQIRQLWQNALEEPFPAGAQLLHGDLHPRNIIVHNGLVGAIIDWGDLTGGDVATDLAVFWMLFRDKPTREKALTAYGADQSLKNRAIGWAIFFGTIFLESGAGGDKRHADIGASILQNIATE